MSRQVDAFTTMVIAEAAGEATPEEEAMLRADENVEQWKRELTDYITELITETKRRKAYVAAMRAQVVHGHELREATAESMAFEVAANEKIIAARRKAREAEGYIKDLKRRRNEENIRRAEERRALRISAMKEDRNRYREALYEAKRFVETLDGKEELLPARDALLKKLDAVL